MAILIHRRRSKAKGKHRDLSPPPRTLAGGAKRGVIKGVEDMMDVKPLTRRADGTLTARMPGGVRAGGISLLTGFAMSVGIDFAQLPTSSGTFLRVMEAQMNLPPVWEATLAGGALVTVRTLVSTTTFEAIKARFSKKGPHSEAVMHWRLKADALPSTLRVGAISDEKLREVCAEVAELVEIDTGMAVDLEQLLLVQQSGKALHERLARSGRWTDLPSEEKGDGLRERGAALADRALLATYVPFDHTLVIVPEAVKDATGDSLREALYVQLIHAAQHQHHPAYFQSVEHVARAHAEAVKQKGPKSAEAEESRDQLEARLMLLEGHARYLQQYGRALRFPDAKVGPRNLFLTALAPGVMIQRLSSQRIFQRIQNQDRLEDLALMEQLYTVPGLADVAFRKMREFRVPFPEGASEEAQAAMAVATAELLSLRKNRPRVQVG